MHVLFFIKYYGAGALALLAFDGAAAIRWCLGARGHPMVLLPSAARRWVGAPAIRCWSIATSDWPVNITKVWKHTEGALNEIMRMVSQS